MDNVAIEAKAKTGPPLRQRPVLCLRMVDGPGFYCSGLPYGWGSVYKYEYPGQWTRLSKGIMPNTSQIWEDWSFRAFGDKLQLVVGGEILAETSNSDFARGSVGVRVVNASFYLDDIRVRKFSLPEPAVTLPPRK